MKTKVYVSITTYHNLLDYFGEANVEEMLRGYQLVVVDDEV